VYQDERKEMLVAVVNSENWDNIKNWLRPKARAIKRRLFEFSDWKSKDYTAPSPKALKDRVLFRNAIPGGIWVETGTYLGETTKLLARWSGAVYSLEPADMLYKRAARLFASQKHVSIINAPSEEAFPTLLPSLKGPVNFWLDGHFSAGPTFQGEVDTPIMAELDSISQHKAVLEPVCIMIDDIRCFSSSLPEYSNYPSLDMLVDWARQQDMEWHIEQDIMIIRSRIPLP
jgi:hypothetical protein